MAFFGASVSGNRCRVIKDSVLIGGYYIAHYGSQASKRVNDLLTIKNMGFDYIATPCAAGDTALFTQCRDLGLGLMIEYNDDPASVISAVSSYGVAFAHIPGDDVDLMFANAAAYQVQEDAYKALNPDFLTLASVTNGNTKSAEFAGISDMTGFQVYPIDFETMEAMEYHYVNARTACTAANTPMLGHVQLHQWRVGGVTRRSPTPAEFKVMAWGALQYGCEGILIYALFDYYTESSVQYNLTDIFEITDAKMNLRNAVKNFIDDVRRYEHFFLRGTRSHSYNSSGLSTTWLDAETNTTLKVVTTFSTMTVNVTLEV